MSSCLAIPAVWRKIAQFLDEPHFYCQHREYTTWLGKVDGETVMVMSTGMGGPSTAIGVEECYKTGVRTFIRIGTTGGINLKVMGGDLCHRQQCHSYGGHHPRVYAH